MWKLQGSWNSWKKGIGDTKFLEKGDWGHPRGHKKLGKRDWGPLGSPKSYEIPGKRDWVAQKAWKRRLETPQDSSLASQGTEITWKKELGIPKGHEIPGKGD